MAVAETCSPFSVLSAVAGALDFRNTPVMEPMMAPANKRPATDSNTQKRFDSFCFSGGASVEFRYLSCRTSNPEYDWRASNPGYDRRASNVVSARVSSSGSVEYVDGISTSRHHPGSSRKSVLWGSRSQGRRVCLISWTLADQSLSCLERPWFSSYSGYDIIGFSQPKCIGRPLRHAT